jgi:uncharacterized delta-60 repeat protein
MDGMRKSIRTAALGAAILLVLGSCTSPMLERLNEVIGLEKGTIVTGVTLSETQITVAVEETHQLTATIIPATAVNKDVTWGSDNAAVATVSADGLVTGVAAGSATITVTTVDGNKTATCAVSVAIAVTGVTLDQTNIFIVIGGTRQLVATVEPDNATEKSVTWASDNEAAATVTVDPTDSSKAQVDGVAAGQATITVTTKAGAKTATCNVTVFHQPGELDKSFGIGGGIQAYAYSPTTVNQISSFAVKSDNSIVMAGMTDAMNQTFVCKITNTGIIDADFIGLPATIGYAAWSGTLSGTACSMAISQNGIFLATLNTTAYPLTFEYNDSGKYTSYNASAQPKVDSFWGSIGSPKVAIQKSDGHIVLAMGSATPNVNTYLTRYTEGGQPDISFDLDGYVQTWEAAGSIEVDGVAIDPNGKILVLGNDSSLAPMKAFIARHNTDGSRDNTGPEQFGDGAGMKLYNMPGGAGGKAFFAEFLSSGKILVLGKMINGSTDPLYFMRLTDTGNVEFGPIVIEMGNSHTPTGLKLIMPDGKILFSFQVKDATDSKMTAYIGRLNNDSNLSIDQSFGTDPNIKGFVKIHNAGTDIYSGGFGIQPGMLQDQIVTGGFFMPPNQVWAARLYY